MIDLHSHILPNVDDGSESLEQTLSMLATLSSQGVTTVVATPHFYADEQSIDSFIQNRNEAYNSVFEKIKDSDIKIVLGAEVKYYSGISHIDGIEKLTFQNSRLLLLEMPFKRWTEYELREVCEIAGRGNITVVLAHIDRYLKYGNLTAIKNLIENGVLMQCNASFFASAFTVRKALRMLKNYQIHFIGTDCHNMTSRPPDMSAALKAISKKFGLEFTEDFINYGNEMFLYNTIKNI